MAEEFNARIVEMIHQCEEFLKGLREQTELLE